MVIRWQLLGQRGHFARSDQLFLRVHVRLILHHVALKMLNHRYDNPRCKISIILLGRGKQNLEFSLKIIVALEMVFDDDNDHVKELPF